MITAQNGQDAFIEISLDSVGWSELFLNFTCGCFRSVGGLDEFMYTNLRRNSIIKWILTMTQRQKCDKLWYKLHNNIAYTNHGSNKTILHDYKFRWNWKSITLYPDTNI